MIQIGLTTWKEHGSLLHQDELTLSEYASVLPIVEINTTFYGIRSKAAAQDWLKQTPDTFKFIIKAYQGITRQRSWEDSYASEKEMYQAFFDFLQPLRDSGRLAAILFQFPSFFDCTEEHIVYLRKLRKIFPDDMMAIELRNTSWYDADMLPFLLAFMRKEKMSLVIVDQPQVAIHSVPFVPEVTNPEFVYVRLHGRNKGNWLDKSPDWRKKRNLYRYSADELAELAAVIRSLNGRETAVIFNNNSAGDAADNAMMLKDHLHITYEGLNPSQTSLF